MSDTVDVIVFVPGIMGTELWDGDRKIWPGSVAELLLPYDEMAALTRDGLRAEPIIYAVGPAKQYGHLVSSLGELGFVESRAPFNLFTCPYDWRKDNRESAKVLARRIEDAHDRHGDAARITLVGHSMGGLVSRYYLESGRFSGRRGFAQVTQLITLGTPHRGAPEALAAALGQAGKLFLSKAQVRQLCSDPRFPALYQLLPPQGDPFVWGSALGNASVDLHTGAAEWGLVEANLKAAREFHGELDPARRPKHVRYFCFYGTRHKTVVHAVVGASGPTGRAVADAGDGTVPTWSAVLPGVQSFPVGGEHGAIYKDRALLRTLASVLGVGRSLDVGAGSVSVAPDVVEAGESVEIAIELGIPIESGPIWLRWARWVEEGSHEGAFEPLGATRELTYAGPQLSRLTVVVPAPEARGLYRVGFSFADDGPAEATADLWVRDRPEVPAEIVPATDG